MASVPLVPARFIGLDVHKHYLVAVGVDADQHQVFGPQRVSYDRLDDWIAAQLTPQDAVVLEMTTNSFELHDQLQPHVHSVTVVHPPHVALITRAHVKTDRKAALTLAQLHAAKLLPAVWVPSPEVRALRGVVAQRAAMVRLGSQARNRLQAVLQRHRLVPPAGGLFRPEQRAWWRALPVSALEQARIHSDLATLAFADEQVTRLEQHLAAAAAADERVPLLIQLPGINLIGAITLLAAIGEITRFATASQLVGYAGMGTRVHDSGQTHHTGRLTKAGRRDIRTVMVEAAQSACQHHPYWAAELARLEPRLGRNKAVVAIARKLLVVVWQVLTKRVADRQAQPEQVARFLASYAYRLGAAHRPADQTVAAYVRAQLDRLGIGATVMVISKGGGRQLKLPPSQLADAG